MPSSSPAPLRTVDWFTPTVEQGGIPEDPVTGSVHAALAPYWAARPGRMRMTGLQVSCRSGRVGVRVSSDRVTVTGGAVTVFDGVLNTTAEPGFRKR